MKTRYSESWRSDGMTALIDEMVGKTMVSVTQTGNYELVFTDTDGVRYIFYHDQDCCEHVDIDDICGELDDLVGHPLVQAEEASNEGAPPPPGDYNESWTWTFYKFATMKGYVTVKWLGESNGYYSESVDFRIEEP